MPTPFAKRVADIASRQYGKYRYMREQEPALAAQIEKYWNGIGKFPGTSTPWSAVFISWCMREAGATASEFRFASAHARFVHAAIRNADTDTGVFKGRDPALYAPKVGDIVQNNRGRHKFDFAFARREKGYESHSAIVIEVGVDQTGPYLRTIGGNESDSVGLKEARLTSKGLLRNADSLYISVIENLR